MSSLPYQVLTVPRPAPASGAKGRADRTRRLLLITLAILIEAGETAPTCARIGELIGLRRRAIQLQLRVLEAEGAIVAVKRAGRGRGVEYRIDLDQLGRLGRAG